MSEGSRIESHASTQLVSTHPITVLLIDDQPLIGEMVRQMLADENDLNFHYCSDPTQALRQANTVRPTVILQDLVMPDIEGLTLVRFLRANPPTRDVPLIVLSSTEDPVIKAQAFALGANDYLVKWPDKVELIARLRYHSRGYIALLERNEAYRRLAESRQQLADEIDRAARYVRSLLPEPLPSGPLRIDWRFSPSSHLGGDSFSYHWLDDEHFAIFLLDVSGHGVGASLLSVSALNVLRAQSLPDVDFRDPCQVMRGLNSAFDMEEHDDKYFTIWYGVYQTTSRMLTYSNAAHPPALLLHDPSLSEVHVDQLDSLGPWIGMDTAWSYEARTVEVAPRSQLYVFSDGAYEIHQPDGSTWQLNEMIAFLCGQRADPARLDHLLSHVRQLHGSPILDDDLSIIDVTFPT